MRYIKGILVLVLVLFPTAALAETISNFDSEIRLNTDGSFVVSETIDYDFGGANKHGIFRYIPLQHPEDTGSVFTKRYMEITPLSIQVDGHTVPYETTKTFENIEFKIGDPDTTITGAHTYLIVYRVDGGLLYHDNLTELYWNVTGSDWPVPIEHVSATLNDPDGVLTGSGWCYAGEPGANTKCGEVSADTTTFGAKELTAGQELTVAHELDSSKVASQILTRIITWYYWVIIALLWLIGLGFVVVRHLIANRTGRTIIAQYEPYEDFKPMYTGLLFDGRLDPHDITAAIVYLAEQGYLKIKKTDRKVAFFFEVDDYAIELRKEVDEHVTAFQDDILSLLFGNTRKVGTEVTLSSLKKNRSQQRKNYKLLTKLRKSLREDLEEHGFYETAGYTVLRIVGAAVAITAAVWLVQVLLSFVTELFIFFVVFMFVTTLLAVALVYRRRTKKGYEALDHLKGFKLFLSTTEKDRYKFHNAPQKSPEQFMEFLPYAIAFGVEKEWAEVFKDITIPNPDWYEGHGGAFSAVTFTDSIGAFSDSFVASSGSSPSSGGGAAGGGAGGGGGGSW